jgi:hypothetical protein
MERFSNSRVCDRFEFGSGYRVGEDEFTELAPIEVSVFEDLIAKARNDLIEGWSATFDNCASELI